MNINNFKRFIVFLREDSPYSTMRLVSTLMILTICFYVLYQTILKLPVDWWGASGFGSVGLGGKMLQKRAEGHNKWNDYDDNDDYDNEHGGRYAEPKHGIDNPDVPNPDMVGDATPKRGIDNPDA